MSVRSLPFSSQLSPPGDLSPIGRHSTLAAVLLFHLLAAAGLWQAVQPGPLPPAGAVIRVDWLALPAPVATPPPAKAAAPRPQPPATRPVIASTAVTAPVTAQAPEAVIAPDPVPAAPPVVAATALASSSPSPVAAAPLQAPAAPRLIPASAVMYRVPPAQVYPLASRRLGEQGTVLLQLVVDTQGLPQSITLHRSSGHARLDEQALQAMRAARFQPHTQNGVATAWMAIAPLRYELE
jgi:periplasmic protein TonB